MEILSTNEISFNKIKKAAGYLNIENADSFEYLKRKVLLELISEKDKELALLLKDYLSNSEMYSFIKTDKELRIKAPDLFESSISSQKEKFFKSEELVEEFFKQKNWK